MTLAKFLKEKGVLEEFLREVSVRKKFLRSGIVDINTAFNWRCSRRGRSFWFNLYNLAEDLSMSEQEFKSLCKKYLIYPPRYKEAA